MQIEINAKEQQFFVNATAVRGGSGVGLSFYNIPFAGHYQVYGDVCAVWTRDYCLCASYGQFVFMGDIYDDADDESVRYMMMS